MKKILMLIPLCMLVYTAVIAQNEANSSSGANHAAVLALSNGIDISYMTTGDGSGQDAIMSFKTPNDYTNGVTSASQQLRVRSNRTFKVAVRCDANTFAYEGNGNQSLNDMPTDALWLKVTANNTGGSVKAPFSTSNFASLSHSNQDLLVDGSNGGNQTFSVVYKCTPGFNLPAGTYSMNVVYTATQE
ncbi:MAG: hypothetical protein KDC07_07555 [Chitinophagaceae bacterium]|nr:hypothetical protein [Chitinophagaceae bacterium]MCB9047184.1 hypothetical protein [Chitinophagales bacterium]